MNSKLVLWLGVLTLSAYNSIPIDEFDELGRATFQLSVIIGAGTTETDIGTISSGDARTLLRGTEGIAKEISEFLEEKLSLYHRTVPERYQILDYRPIKIDAQRVTIECARAGTAEFVGVLYGVVTTDYNAAEAKDIGKDYLNLVDRGNLADISIHFTEHSGEIPIRMEYVTLDELLGRLSSEVLMTNSKVSIVGHDTSGKKYVRSGLELVYFNRALANELGLSLFEAAIFFNGLMSAPERIIEARNEQQVYSLSGAEPFETSYFTVCFRSSETDEEWRSRIEDHGTWEQHLDNARCYLDSVRIGRHMVKFIEGEVRLNASAYYSLGSRLRSHVRREYDSTRPPLCIYRELGLRGTWAKILLDDQKLWESISKADFEEVQA